MALALPLSEGLCMKEEWQRGQSGSLHFLLAFGRIWETDSDHPIGSLALWSTDNPIFNSLNVCSLGCSTLCTFRVLFAADNARGEATGQMFIGPHPTAYCTYGRDTEEFMLRGSKPVCVQRKMCSGGVYRWMRLNLKRRRATFAAASRFPKLPRRCWAALRFWVDSVVVAFWPTDDVTAANTLNKQRPAMPVIVNKKMFIGRLNVCVI